MKTLKAVAARYNATSLILRIVIGLVVGAVLTAVPGIVAQLILIPLIVAALQKAKLTD